MKNFVEIEVGKIFPHPNNPRKDLGELTELAESIKENGIMQNLTVVKRDDKSYTVIIGHRRLEASKMAGLSAVPCVISDMDEKKQLSTMLLENMQRSDLTVLEQAEGFQMMMDLGETASSISKATGFSETTVRHRLKLLELDRDKLKATENRGATLSDYIELEKIKDIDKRNEVLETIGTSNFNYSLKNAIEEEKWQEKKADIIEKLSVFAKETKVTSGMEYVTCYGKFGINEVEVPKDIGSEKYFYNVSGTYIYLYRKRNEKVDEAVDEFKRKQAGREREREEKKAKLIDMTKTALKCREEFVLNFHNTEKFKKEILSFCLKALMEDMPYGVCDYIYEHYNIDDEFEPYAAADEVLKKENPLKAVLVYCWYGMEDNGDSGYFDWYGRYKQNEELDIIYDFLEAVGYEISDAEREMKEGTSELYINE